MESQFQVNLRDIVGDNSEASGAGSDAVLGGFFFYRSLIHYGLIVLLGVLMVMSFGL